MLVAVGYGAGSQLAFTWFNADGDNASFFPAAGVGLAALVLLERRLWPLVLATLAVTEIGLDVYHDIDLVGAVGYAIANAAQAFAGAVLLRRIAAPPSLAKTRDLGAFVACGVVAGPAIGGALGASTFVFLQEGDGWLRFAWEWLVGDGLGALVVAGVALTMADPTTRQRLTRDNTAAFGLLLLATTASVVGVFWLESFSLAYLPVLLLAVAAVVTGPAGVAACGASIAFVGAQATARGHNFWDALNVSAETGMLYLQTSIAFVLLGALAIAAVIGEREEASAGLARSEVSRAVSQAEAERAELLAGVSAGLESELRFGERAAALLDLLVPRLADFASLQPTGPGSHPWAQVGHDAGADAGQRVVIPLGPQGAESGELVLGTSPQSKRTFRHPDLALFAEVAKRAGLALENARLFEAQTEIAVRLQHALMPENPATVEGVSTAAVYLAAQGPMTVGGDWYEAMELRDGRLALAIGDVVGHGLLAAASMGKLRTAVQAFALLTNDPAALVDLVDDFARTTEATEFATLCYAVLDPRSGELLYASAGHPPILVVTADGEARFLQGARSGPLCTLRQQPRQSAVESLEPGSMLAFFSDGLFERRGTVMTDQLGRLTAAAERASSLGVAQARDAIVSAMTDSDGPRTDDIVLMCVRYTGEALEPRVVRACDGAARSGADAPGTAPVV